VIRFRYNTTPFGNRLGPVRSQNPNPPSSVVQRSRELAAAAETVVDFYIGKPGQRRVRDRLEMWWLRLSDVRWGNFGRGEALCAVQVMDRIFGRRIFAALARTGDGGASSLRLSERQNA